MELFKLFGSIFVDNDKANESIKKTDGFAANMGKTFVTASVAVGAAVGAGATALYGMAMQSAETADRVDKLSNKMGMSKQAFQEWDYVLGQNGMDVEKLQVGVKTLTAQMDAVSQGNKSATANFESLGLSIYDASGAMKSQEEMTKEAIMALAGMENSTEKARLATEMFGKAGIEMMPMLNGGAEGIAELTERSHELGLVMSDESVTAGVVLGDTMDDVKASFGAVVTKVGAEVMPIIQQLLEWVLANMPQIQAITSKAFEVISVVVTTTVDVLKVVIEWFQNLVKASQENGSSMNKIWTDIKKFFLDTFNNIIGFVKSFIEMFQAFWSAYGDTIMIYIKGAWEQIKIIFDTVFKVINDLLKIFTALFKGDWEGMWEAIKQLCKDIWDGIKQLVENSLDTMIKVFKDIVPKMLEAGKNIMNGVWDGIKDVWNNISEWVTEKVEWLVDKLKFWDNGVQDMSESTPSNYAQGNSGNGNNKTSYINGSFATGLAYVPYDGFIAETHEGERILTKEENIEYKQLKNKGGNQSIVVDNKETNDLLRQLIKRLDNIPIKFRNEKLFG